MTLELESVFDRKQMHGMGCYNFHKLQENIMNKCLLAVFVFILKLKII